MGYRRQILVSLWEKEEQGMLFKSFPKKSDKFEEH
jgi:hypothetical protein